MKFTRLTPENLGKEHVCCAIIECILDSKEKGVLGLCIISSLKKKPFLPDPKYLNYKGFQIADMAKPKFTLFYLPFSEDAPKPCFCFQVKTPEIQKLGFVLYYSHQCPFTAKYVPLLQASAPEMGILFKTVLIDSKEKAKNVPAAVINFALFYHGQFVIYEILSIGKFEKLAEKLRKQNED